MACLWVFTALVIFLAFPASLTLPANWQRVSDAEPQQPIKLIIAVKLINTDWLDERFWAVSNPQSPDYGQHLNFDEIAKVVRARPGAVDRIISLLRRHHVTTIDVTLGENYVITQMSCASANQMFSTTFGSYMNEEYPEIVVHKATAYVIPEEIADDIDFVLGVDNFPTVSPQYRTRIRRKPLLAGKLGITPPTILQSYNISSYQSSSPGNSQAVASFLDQFFKPSDLSEFQKRYDVPSDPINKVVGKNNDRDPGIEASLDVQYITGVGRKVATW
jgi:tripeptidyl-peptidase-1